MELNELKKEYAKLEKKYQLPSFSELNEAFEIEKIDKESEVLARVIRKIMMDKVVNSLGFFDMLMNPMQAPRIYHPFIKNMSSDDKSNMEIIYNSFGKLSLDCMSLELDCSEKAEAIMIKRIFDEWNKLKPKFKALIDRISNPGNVNNKKEKSYYG